MIMVLCITQTCHLSHYASIIFMKFLAVRLPFIFRIFFVTSSIISMETAIHRERILEALLPFPTIQCNFHGFLPSFVFKKKIHWNVMNWKVMVMELKCNGNEVGKVSENNDPHTVEFPFLDHHWLNLLK